MSILSLIYRTAGAWGAGKGANLTPAEVDQNFYDLEVAVETLAANPTLPAEIEDVEVTDGNQLTFMLSSGATLGPVTLPSSKPTWREDWLPETAYIAGDLFHAVDPLTLIKGLYYTNRNFTSGIAFDPNLGIGVGGVLPYVSFVLTVPDKVRVAWFWPTKPGEGLPILESSGDFAPMFSFLTVDYFVLPASLTGSVANLRTAPDAEVTFVIRQNGTEIGDLTFAAGSFTPVFTFASSIGFVPGDVLTMDGPASVDALAECLSVTVVGTLGELDSSSSS
jgi:hypothetical protein